MRGGSVKSGFSSLWGIVIQVVAAADPEKVILLGSCARRDQDEGRDIGSYSLFGRFQEEVSYQRQRRSGPGRLGGCPKCPA